MIGAKEDEAWVRKFDGRNFADVDAAIVATHVMLAIHDLGLVSTWIGNFDPAVMKAAFPVMEGLDLIALFPVAYPAQDAAPGTKHTVSRECAELVCRL